MSSLIRLKSLATVVAGQSPPSDEVRELDDGCPFIQGNAEFGVRTPTPKWECDQAPKRAAPGDLLLSVRAPVGALNVASTRIGIGRGVAAVRAGDARYQRWLYWALEASRDDLISRATGSTFDAVSASDIGELRLSMPDDPIAIADYLDHETAEIDAFIADLGLTKSMLLERWRALRDSELSGGKGAVFDQRIGFGRIDPSWRVGAIKNLFSVTLGKMLDEKKHSADELLPYVRAANIGDGQLDLDDLNQMPFDDRERDKYSLRRGDVLVVEGGSVGMNVVLDEDVPGVYFQKTVNRLRPLSDVSSVFYSEVINAFRESGLFDVIGNRSTIMHLTAEKLGGLLVPVPTPAEQHRIAGRLLSARAETAAELADIDAAIALAKERRAALITEVVTGQIDVSTQQRPVVDSIQTTLEEAR